MYAETGHIVTWADVDTQGVVYRNDEKSNIHWNLVRVVMGWDGDATMPLFIVVLVKMERKSTSLNSYVCLCVCVCLVVHVCILMNRVISIRPELKHNFADNELNVQFSMHAEETFLFVYRNIYFR